MVTDGGRPRVLVTRPSADALPLAAALQVRGFDVLLQPLLRIDFEDGPPVGVGGVQALLFTSANGVRAFARRSELRTLPVYAVGDATAEAARAERFLSVASAGGNVDDLAALVSERLDPAGGKLLHIAGNTVAGDLAGALGTAGFAVERVALYTAVRAEALDPAIHSALAAGAVDAALFFSPRSASSFVKLLRDAALTEACGTVRAVCLSGAVAEALSPVSWRAIAVAPEPTQESLLATLEREVTDTSKPDTPATPQATETTDGPDRGDPDLLDRGDAEAVVDRFGGIRPMASKLGIPVTTVQGWRGRGHIPGNRTEEIRRAAVEHGVDLSAGPEAAAPSKSQEPDEAPEAAAASGPGSGKPAPQPPQTAAPQAIAGGSGVAWAALVLAVVALAGVASYRFWAPFVGAEPGSADALAARVEKLESREAPSSRSDARVDQLAQKVETLSRQVAARPAGGAGDGKAVAAATAEIAALRATVESLTQKAARGETRARAADSETSESLDALRAEIAALKKSVSEIDGRVKAIESRPPATGGRIAALAIAAGQLETALDSGRPYAGALDRLKALATGDTAIEGALGKLADGASTGVPTVATLARGFAEIAPSLTVPATAESESGWAATLRAKALSLVNMRPVGDDGDASPVTRAERALARNDLSGAVAALGTVPGDAAAAWRTRAQARLDANAAVGAVRARIVDRLAAESQTAAQTPSQTPSQSVAPAGAAPAAKDSVAQ